MILYFLNFLNFSLEFLNFFTNLGPGYKTQTSLFFKDPATSLMENIIELHNFIFYFILIVPKLLDPIFVPYPFLKSKSSLISGLHTVLWPVLWPAII